MTPPPPPGASFGFSGSYAPEDVTFLLKVVEMAPLPIEERERRIQAGEAHYSEMIGPEGPPDPAYLAVFHGAVRRGLPRLARDFLNLAAQLAEATPGPMALASIARSGTPVGVILARTLRRHFGREVRHYCVSVIRDKGIDQNALKFILKSHDEASLALVDGWTGKGAIAKETQRSVAAINKSWGTRLPEGLAVLSDLAGVASMAAGTDDYLIPSCLLNSVVSGLISRTILAPGLMGPGDFHGCLFYGHLAPWDLSKWLADAVMAQVDLEAGSGPGALAPSPVSSRQRHAAREASQAFMAAVKERLGVIDDNLVKPGLGEATRVLLRRSPGRVFARDLADPDVAHLLILAKERGVEVEEEPSLPYRAAAVIKSLA